MVRVALAFCLLVLATSAGADDWSDGWRRMIRPADRVRLARLWPAWTAAREQVATAGGAGTWTELGALTDPTPRLANTAPAPGAYRCRLVRLGSQRPGGATVAALPPVACRIDRDADGQLTLAGGDGAQRTTGQLYRDGDRIIFLGAVTLRGEMAPFAYGRDPDRNQVGLLERIGPDRWRLALPWPRWQSTLDVVDIVPAG